MEESFPDMRHIIIVKDPASERLLLKLKGRDDINAFRIKRLLDLPDLSRKKNSPVKFIVDSLIKMPAFKNFDIIEIPEIVDVRDNFDLLNTPADHPSRKESDTYYIDKDHVLRTHTTTMWSFYLQRPEIAERLNKSGHLQCLCYGKVYRKDEIDRNHFPVFHQIDGLYICKRDEKIIGIPDLKEVLVDIAKNILGMNTEYKFLEDSFPFTDPSIQIEIRKGDEWIEVVGAGVVHPKVLKNLKVDPVVYNGWAFGFGVERLAMVKMRIPDIRIFWSDDHRIVSQFKNIDSQYKSVSKFPIIRRDISFVVDENMILNNYYEIIRDCARNLIEEVKLLDRYENEARFGNHRVSYTFRIIYRSHERTLTNKEVNSIQAKIEEKTRKELSAELR